MVIIFLLLTQSISFNFLLIFLKIMKIILQLRKLRIFHDKTVPEAKVFRENNSSSASCDEWLVIPLSGLGLKIKIKRVIVGRKGNYV